MKMILVAGSEKHAAAEITAYWDLSDVPDGQFSIPQLLHEKLLQIRGEHAAWAYQTAFCRIGGRSMAGHLRCGAALSMWWTSLIYERHPKMTPWLYEIYKLRCLELFCREHGIKSITLKGGDGKLERTLLDFCGKTGRGFVRLAGGEAEKEPLPLSLRLYHVLPAPLRALLRHCHWWLRIKRWLPYSRRQPQAGKDPALIAVYFPNIDLAEAGRGNFVSRYWESLHGLLHEEAKKRGGQFVNWLFIRFPQPGLSFGQCLELRDAFRRHGHDGASFNYLEEFLTAGDQWRALWRWLKLCAASLLIESRAAREFHFADSAVNFWEYARADWAESFRGWRALERCLQNQAFLRRAQESPPMRFHLFPVENCPWERMLTAAARQTPGSGPVAGAQHSSLRPTDFRYFDDPGTFTTPECAVFQPDLYCANGKSALVQWLDSGMPQERLRETEALRYLYLAQKKHPAEAPAASLPAQAGEPLADGSARKLLVLTSFFRGESERLCQILAQALQGGLLAGWQVTVKPHPYFPVRGLLARLLGKEAERLRFAEGPIALELVAGVTVLAANSTTAALEAAIMRLPLMVMKPTDDFDLCPIQNVPGLARVLTLADLRASLEKNAPVDLPEDYLCLDPALPAWRKILHEFEIIPAAGEKETKMVETKTINVNNGQKAGRKL